MKKRVIPSGFHVIEKAAWGYAKLVGQKTRYNISGLVAIDPKRIAAQIQGFCAVHLRAQSSRYSWLPKFVPRVVDILTSSNWTKAA
jgi:hypothetical protein